MSDTTMRGRFFAAGLATLAVGGTILVSAGSTPASALDRPGGVPAGTLRIGPSPIYNAPNHQDYEDSVTAAFTTTAKPGQVQYVLTAGPNVTWWKGIRVTDKAGKVLASDFTQDAKHRTAMLTVGKAAVTNGAYIIFSKAKTFGVHTDMYTVPIPPADLGYRIDINWVRDD
jgi:hypothetical protein